MKRTYRIVDEILVETTSAPIDQHNEHFIKQDWVPRGVREDWHARGEIRHGNWWNYTCECCEFPYMEQADELPRFCPACAKHQPVERCELVCEACKKPSYEHPVTLENMYCTHGGTMIIDKKVIERWKRMQTRAMTTAVTFNNPDRDCWCRKQTCPHCGPDGTNTRKWPTAHLGDSLILIGQIAQERT